MPDILDEAVQNYVTSARSQVAAGFGTSPQDAARSVQMEDITQTPAPLVAQDVAEFDKTAKQNMASAIVERDPQLMAYVHSHPMAAAVSQNDWGNLSNISTAAGLHSQVLRGLNAPWERGFDAALDAAKDDFNAPITSYSPQDVLERYPALGKGPFGALAATVGAFGIDAGALATEAPSNLFMGLVHGVGAGMQRTLTGFGMSESSANLLARDTMGELERRMTDPGVAALETAHTPTVAETTAIREAQLMGSFIHTIRTYGEGGKEVPRGVVPALDQARAGVNEQLLTQFDDVVKQAQASETKGLAPGLFRNFMEQHYGDRTIGISGDAAVALYGDKIPEPDDGLLGFVPGIADKLDVARRTGADVEVPLADWVAGVDPAIAKGLHDDLRIWPGGVTAREGAELGQVEPRLMVEDTLPNVRGSSGLEPMFSVGDRKFTLTQTDTAGEMHGLDIHDETGRPIGGVVITPEGKNLTIENINGIAGIWSNSLGPAAMRDLLRQLKAMYPDAETVSGYRVTGAREGRPETITVKLNAPIGWDQVEPTRRLLQYAWREVGSRVYANVAPGEFYTVNEAAMAGVVHDELAKITGKKADVRPVAGIAYNGRSPGGVYFNKSGLILYDLLGDDPLGVGRHESIHFLKDQGLFSTAEWTTLNEAAEQEGWLDRYGINERYAHLSPDRKNEEAIAEAFKEWARQGEEARRQYSPVAQIFQKIMDLLNRIQARFKELFGRELTPDELFQRISSGEVGQRAQQGTGGTAPEALFSMDELDNLKASGLGLDAKTFANLQKLTQERYERDLARYQARAEKEQAKRQGAEWKSNREEMRKEVEQTVRQRPDIAVDQLLGSGQINGVQMPQRRYSLLESNLTAEQKKLLPPSYYSKSGFPVDEVAKQFGYPSGDAMVEALGRYNAAKAGRSVKDMLEHTIDVETDRQMEAKYGDKATNILSEARDQALSEADVHLVTEEYRAAAEMAGVTAVDKAVIKAAAKDAVDKMPFSELSSDKFLALVRGAQDLAVRALANGDPATAVQALQRRTEAMHIAAEIAKVEKLVPKFQRLTKFYAKPWDVTKPSPVEATWSLWTRNMLSKVGLPTGMSIQGMAQRVKGKSLTDYVNEIENANEISGLELPTPDWLLNANAQDKPYSKLSVAEWKDLNQSLVTFDKLGRDEQKAVTADEKVDKAELVGKMARQLAQFFPGIARDISKAGATMQVLGHSIAASTSNETLMSRFDHRDTHGIFTETFSKPAASAANHQATLEREIGKAYRELGPVKDGERTLQSPFKDPRTGQPLDFNRDMLASVISNMGNAYNWKVLTKGWKIDPDGLMKWVEANSTAEDLERAQGLGKIWQGLWDQSSAMYERLYGMAPEAVEPRPFTMHGKEWDGWYHPIIGDPVLSRYVNQLPAIDKAERNYWPSVSNNYTKRRTGAIQVIDLSYDQIPVRLSQEIHDIAFREFVANTAKLMKDQRFRQAVSGHYGKEYMDQMDGWLQRAAGKNSFNGAAMQLAQRWSNELRQNVISTYVAFNPITAAKHGSTAWMMSSRELDANLFKSVPKFLGFTAELKMNQWFGTAVNDLYGKSPEMGDKLWSWAMETSEELKRRERNWQDTIGGAQGLNQGERRLRDRVAQVGASLVAWSDLQSAVPLWVAKYREEFARSAEHGTAVREADMAVRRAHGSTAVTNLPAIATSQDILGPWMTSLYGFMGTNMQRRIEIFHDINDQWNLGLKHAISSADSKLPTILSSLATYVIWTGIVEEVASQQFFADHRSLGEKALGWVFGTAAQTVIGLRDVIYDLQTGREDAGLISTIPHDITNLLRDIKANPSPIAKNRVGRFVADSCAVIGDLRGLCPRHVGKAMQYGIDTFSGYQQPHGLMDIERGLVTGSQKQKIAR